MTKTCAAVIAGLLLSTSPLLAEEPPDIVTPVPETSGVRGVDTAGIDSNAGQQIRGPWPTGALLRSVIFPGWGQLYNKKYLKAAIYGGLEIYFGYTARQRWKEMDQHQYNFQHADDPLLKAQEFNLYEESRDSRNIYLWVTGLTLFISMFDAYVDAHLANFDQPDKVFNVQIVPGIEGLAVSLCYNF